MKRLRLIALLILASTLLTACQLSLPYQKKAGLQVITEGGSASLFLNDQYLDTTPYINKKILPGAYRLKIQPSEEGKVPFETPLRLNQGILTVVTWKAGSRPETSGGVIYEMEKIGGKKTQLSIVTIPDGALVQIDGGEQQIAPLVLDNVAPGEHRIALTQPSYEGQEHTINIVEGFKLSASVKLARLEGESMPPSSPSPPIPTATSAATVTTATTSASKAATQSSQTVAKPRVLIKATGYQVQGIEVLRVRSAPSSAGTEIGQAPVGSYLPYAGESQAGWYAVTFEGKTGWVSAQYATLEQ